MMEKTTVPYDTMSVNSASAEPVFSRCCCCIPLRIGCFILGYITLFYNALRTIFLVGITMYWGVKTHGFDHIDDDQVDPTVNPISNMDHKPVQALGWILLTVTIFDLIWLAINIACLVGIHKKRPGPIRTFVAFATFRLIMNMIVYMYQLNMSEGSQPHIIAHCIDLGLTAYFILVYYMYAMRLTKEAQLSQSHGNDVAYIYPKMDKKHLVA